MLPAEVISVGVGWKALHGDGSIKQLNNAPPSYEAK